MMHFDSPWSQGQDPNSSTIHNTRPDVLYQCGATHTFYIYKYNTDVHVNKAYFTDTRAIGEEESLAYEVKWRLEY